MENKILNSVKPYFLIFLATLNFIPFMNCSQNFQSQNSLLDSASLGTSLAAGTLVINEPPMQFSTKDKVTLKGNCSSGVRIDVTGDVMAPVSSQCSQNLFSIDVYLSDTDGMKNVKITQIDYMGNVKMDSRNFVKDTTPPTLDYTSISDQAWIQNNLTFSGLCESGLSVAVKLGSVTQTVNCSNGMFSSTLNLSQVNDGNVTLEISQTDLVGLSTTKQRSLKKDSLSPSVSIQSPTAGASVVSPVAISGLCEAGINVMIGGGGVASPLTVPCTSGTYSGSVDLQTGVGTREIIVEQTDAAGNKGSVNRSFQATVPSTQIAIQITAPAANSSAKTGVTLQGTCESGLPVVISGAGLSASVNATCTSGAFSVAVTFSANDGVKLISAKQVDGARSGESTRSFMRDNVAPTLTFSAPATNAYVQSTVTASGQCETGLNVIFSGGVNSSTVSCASGSFSTSLTITSGDGTKTITATQTDAAGNVATATRTVQRDTTAPALAITSPAAGTSAATEVSISGTCETGLNVVASGSGAKSMATTACSSGMFLVVVVFSDADGTKLIDLKQTDAAGNIGSAQRSFVRTTPPMNYDGVALYASSCAACHGTLDISAKKDKTAAQITSAIGTVSLMAGLSSLNSGQINAIALALKSTVVIPPTPEQPLTDLTCTMENGPAVQPLQRLSKRQYVNVMNQITGLDSREKYSNDVLGVMGPAYAAIPEDQTKLGFSRMDKLVTSNHVSAYFAIAAQAAGMLKSDSYFFNNRYGAGCMTGASPADTCVQTFIANFGLAAMRRPPTQAEIATHLTNYKADMASGGGSAAANEALIATLLMSPEMIYMVEVGGAAVSGVANTYSLTEYEIAARVSLFFEETAPNSTLINLAKNGKLSTGSDLENYLKTTTFNQTAAYYDPAKGYSTIWVTLTDVQDSFMIFVNEWLELERRKLAFVSTPIYEEFLKESPTFSFWDNPDELLNDEVRELFNRLFWAENAKYSTLLLTTSYYNTGNRIASYYGYQLSQGSGSTIPVAFQNHTGRLGLLTRAALLVNNDNFTKPIDRGVFLRRKILCDDLPSPNPDALPDRALEAPQLHPSMTTRERYEEKTKSETCQTCHSQINPLGFAMENYDSRGRLRTTEKVYSINPTTQQVQVLGQPAINASIANLGFSSTEAVSANGGIELSQRMAASTKAQACFARQSFRFATGRKENAGDACLISHMYTNLEGAGGSMKNMMIQMAQHPHFKMKKVGP